MNGNMHRGTRRFLYALAGVAWGLLSRSPLASPVTPTFDDLVLEHVVSRNDATSQELRAISDALRKDPGNRTLAVQLARTAISRGQKLADPRYFGQAAAALAPWIAQPDPPTDVRLARAIIRQFNHDFDAALVDLDHILDQEPLNAQARLTRAVIHTVRADYAAAGQDCAKLTRITAPSVATICVASVATLTGHARPALRLLTLVAADADTPVTLRVWALNLIGETASRLGETSMAFRSFEQARILAPDDVYLLASYADALIESGRPEDVAALLAGSTRADALLLRLSEAGQLTGRTNPDHVRQLADSFETSRRRGDAFHRREEARFLLHIRGRAGPALRLAQENWAVQREVADARILVDAAIAAGQPDAATPVLNWRRDNNVEDIYLRQRAEAITNVPKAPAQ